MKFILKICIAVLYILVVSDLNAQNLALTATSAHSGGGATGSPDYSAANYNDGVIANCGSTPWGWVSTNGWIEYTWSSAQTLTKVIFYKDGRPMTTCTIEYWNGTSYTTIMNYNNSATCLDSVTFSPVTTTKLRFNNIAGSGNPNHREIEVYGISCSTEIVKQAVDSTICEEENASFTVNAVDVTNYQWQIDLGSGFNDVVNNANFSGSNTATIGINNAGFDLNGSIYRVIATKSICKDTSDEAILTVNGLVNLQNLKPTDTTCITATKDLQVKADGSIVNFQWQIFVPGVGYVDVPTAPPYTHLGHVLRITGVPDTLDGSRFRCIVNGICDADTTTNLRLTVAPIPSVGLSPRDTFLKPGSIAIFKAEATAAGARYQWQAAPPLGNFVNLNDGGIYSGVKTSQLIVKGISTVQNNFRFRCIIMSSLLCNSPGDTSDEAVLSVDKTSVNNIDGTVSMVLYPNPANASDLYISSNVMASGRKFEYKIVDKTGRVIKAGALSDNNTRIDIGGLAADIYIVQITEQDRIVAQEKFTRL